MKKFILTNNVYMNEFKNIYSFKKKIYSEKFSHLITDFLYIDNDIKKSINLYYNASKELKLDLNTFINIEFNNKKEIIDYIKIKTNLDYSYNEYFNGYSLQQENNNWFERNLKICFIFGILFHYKIFFDINPIEIPYIKDNLKLFYLVEKIINKRYNIDLYYSYFFNKFDFLKDAKSSYNIYKTESLSKNVIVYYKKEDLEKLNINLKNFQYIKIKNNSKYCDLIEELYYFKTNNYSIDINNNFIIFDLLYSKINLYNVKPYFIEEDKIHHISNEIDMLNKNLNNNIKLILLKSISIFPIYLYKEYKIFFKNFYLNIIKNEKGI